MCQFLEEGGELIFLTNYFSQVERIRIYNKEWTTEFF